MKTQTIYILSLSSILFAQACTQQAEPTEEIQTNKKSDKGLILSSEQITKIGLETQAVEQRSISNTVVANGVLDVPTQYMASVTTFMGSFVKSADKHVGEKVTKGQVLATMEGPEFVDLQQQYLEQKSKLEVLKAEYERQTDLSTDSISSQKNFQKAKGDYDMTVSMVEGLRQKLAFTNINFDELHKGKMARTYYVLSPISGYLTDVSAKIGSYVAPGESLMEIVDLSHLHVELNVYESDALSVKEGQRLQITLPSNPGEVYEADIYLIDKEFDMESRSIKVHGHFEEVNTPFIVGMYVEGKIITGETTGWAVPSSAAVFSDNSRFVVLEKSSAEGKLYLPVEITEVKEADGWITLPEKAIADGYSRVVTKGAGYVLAAWMMEE